MRISSVELIVPFLLGTGFLLWAEGGPSISVAIYMAYFALFLGFMPSRGLVVRAIYTLLFPTLPLLPYMLLASSIHLTLNAGFTPVFTNGAITWFGAWTVYSEYLALSLGAALVHFVMLLIKRSYAVRSKV